MLKTRRTLYGPGSSALIDYCEQIRLRRLLQARLSAERSARISAEKSAQVKSQFISMMSHELRTPLNSIIGFSEILLDPNRSVDETEKANYAKLINSSGRHLIQVVNSILEMSKIQSGTYEVMLESHDLADMLRAVVEKISVIAMQKGVIVATRIGADTTALVDEVRLTQCVDNIVANAIKFTEPGGFVTVACERTGEEVVITVSDTGIGMTEEELARAMMPFGQAGHGLDRGVEGTGLGLCIAKDLTELQNGRFEITSESGVGTEVTLRFPATRPSVHAGTGAMDHASPGVGLEPAS